MFMHDLNTDKKPVVLLIHPMLSSASGLQECITDHMGEQYRYLLPDLSGHGDAVSSTYMSAKEEARQIHEYLTEQHCLEIQLGYCASLGGCVLFELMEYKDIVFHHLFFEGVSLYEDAKILYFLSKKMLISRHRQAMKAPLASKKQMEKLYGEDAAGPMVERFRAINEASIGNICYDCSFVHLPVMDETTQRKCIFAYGEKEFDLKNSRKVLPRKYPGAKFMVWEGRRHCERISKDSEGYAAFLSTFMQRDRNTAERTSQ